MSEHDIIGKCGLPPSKIKRENIIEGTIKKRKTRTSKRSLFRSVPRFGISKIILLRKG